ncbi:MAG: FGGY-family carbohydrate kinase [Comamonadaceae bacterium]|nr:FGGY-family carbohydrate kinase [Comamonadaceae bacterium]
MGPRAPAGPIANAIVWQDRRTGRALRRSCARAGLEPTVRRRTGLVHRPVLLRHQARWLLDHVPGARDAAAARRAGLRHRSTRWLLWKLTGGARARHRRQQRVAHACCSTSATPTGTTSCSTLLRRARAALLPRGRAVERRVRRDRRRRCSARRSRSPASPATSRRRCSARPASAPGMAKNTYGTGCFMLMHTGDAPSSLGATGLLTTAALRRSAARAEYALEGSVFIGGAVVQWLRDGLGLIQRSAETSRRWPRSVPDSGGVYLRAGLRRPRRAALGRRRARHHRRPHARHARAAHIARAALESDRLPERGAAAGAMQRDAGAAAWRELRVDGGAARNDLLMQFQADLLGIPVVRPQVTETTALGAAYLAGARASASGAAASTLAALWRAERRFLPTTTRERAAELMARWERAVRPAVAD